MKLVLLALLSTLAQAQEQPNIVVIMMDDMCWADLDSMPNVQKFLVDSGMVFDRMYVANSLCCPNRAAFLTGKFPHNNGVLTNMAPDGGFDRWLEMGLDSTSLPVKMQELGYATGIFGKFLNQWSPYSKWVPVGWDEYNIVDGRYFDYRILENGKVVYYGSQEEEYEADVLAGKITGWISGNSVPFFVYFAPSAPHRVCVPPPRYGTRFDGVTAPRNPNFNEADVSDKPQYIQDLPLLGNGQQAQVDEQYRGRLGTILAVDDAIGQIIETLRLTGQLDNTYIIFTSDNGFELGEHRLTGKQDPYQNSIHVPLLVRGPGVGVGVSDALVSTVDLFPTIIDLANGN